MYDLVAVWYCRRSAGTPCVVELGTLSLHGADRRDGTTTLWIALLFWSLPSGFARAFNMCTGSLRQQLVLPAVLRRIVTVAQVIAYWAIPLGTVADG